VPKQTRRHVTVTHRFPTALLATVAIWGAVAGLLTLSNTPPRYQAQIANTQSDLRVLADALDRLRLDTERYPTNLEGLAALVSDSLSMKGWHGPYLQKPIANDEWGHPYIYISTGIKSYRLMSYGADGQPGGTGYAADLDNSLSP